MPIPQPVRVLASTAIGARLYDLAVMIAWARNPWCVWRGAFAVVEMGECWHKVLELDLVDEMHEAMMDAIDARAAR